MRISLHPEGLAPRIVNLPEWREHLLARLRQQIDLTADPVLVALLRELSAYPGGKHAAKHIDPTANVVVPLEIATALGELSFFSTTMIFGTPVDITLSELALESFFAADAKTDAIVRRAAANS
jgi:hypothetical protein